MDALENSIRTGIYWNTNIFRTNMNIDLELEMEISRGELQLLVLHELRLGRKTAETTNNICDTMDEHASTVRTAQHCLHRFKNENFELDNLPHAGKPAHMDMSLLSGLSKKILG